MNKGSKSFGFKAAAVALVAATSLSLAAPVFADGRRHHDDRGWNWSDRRHDDRGYGGGYGYAPPRYHNHDRHDDDGLAAVAIIGGVLLGAALLSSASQPAYAPPPQNIYAPPPSAYGYGQAPVQAVPYSDVYQTQVGQYCREYQSQVNVGGRMQYGYGTACQQPDGSWRVVN